MEISAPAFAQNFPDYGFTVRHKLAGLPAFDLPNLVELSRRLPAGSVEYNAGTVTPGQDPSQTPMNGLSAEETIQRIEHCKSWMALKNVESDPEYKALLDACLDEIYPHTQGILTDLHQRSAFIFITSPGSVTPFHFDPEHNFLLQIRGEKTMHQFDKYDRSILPEPAIERIYEADVAHRNQVFHDEFQAKAQTFTLHPGDGLFVPTNSPHWVQNGDEVSVSFSITFRSAQSRRIASLYKLNGWMRRKLGVSPSPVGHRPPVDTLKIGAIETVRSAKNILMR
jgi:hypothetical protein